VHTFNARVARGSAATRAGLAALLALTLLVLAAVTPADAHAQRAGARCLATRASARRRTPAARSCRHAGARKNHKRASAHGSSGKRSSTTSGRRGHRRPAVSEPRTPPSTSAETSTQKLSATIATVLETPCVDTEITPEPADLALVRAAVLCLINRERAEHGVQPLVANAELEAAAESHAGELVEQDYFAHVSPSGETPVQRIRVTGYIPSPYDGYVIGENLAWGTYDLSTPQQIVNAWIASPPHLANILEAQYRETGIGVSPAVPASLAEGAPGATYAQEFGVIIR
jgi:uncharacterized protein YkwD